MRWGETLKGFCNIQHILNYLARPLEVIDSYLAILLYLLILLIFMPRPESQFFQKRGREQRPHFVQIKCNDDFGIIDLNHVWVGEPQIGPHFTIMCCNILFEVLLGPIYLTPPNLEHGSAVRDIDRHSLLVFIQTVHI